MRVTGDIMHGKGLDITRIGNSRTSSWFITTDTVLVSFIIFGTNKQTNGVVGIIYQASKRARGRRRRRRNSKNTKKRSRQIKYSRLSFKSFQSLSFKTHISPLLPHIAIVWRFRRPEDRGWKHIGVHRLHSKLWYGTRLLESTRIWRHGDGTYVLLAWLQFFYKKRKEKKNVFFLHRRRFSLPFLVLLLLIFSLSFV